MVEKKYVELVKKESILEFSIMFSGELDFIFWVNKIPTYKSMGIMSVDSSKNLLGIKVKLSKIRGFSLKELESRLGNVIISNRKNYNEYEYKLLIDKSILSCENAKNILSNIMKDEIMNGKMEIGINENQVIVSVKGSDEKETSFMVNYMSDTCRVLNEEYRRRA